MAWKCCTVASVLTSHSKALQTQKLINQLEQHTIVTHSLRSFRIILFIPLGKKSISVEPPCNILYLSFKNCSLSDIISLASDKFNFALQFSEGGQFTSFGLREGGVKIADR